MRQLIRERDLLRARALQEEALRAINRGDYDAAIHLANAIDQGFYNLGIDLVEAADCCDNNLDELRKRHNGNRTPWWGGEPRVYSWEIRR